MVKTLLLPGGGGGKRGGAGSIPGWVTKIPHAGQHSQKERERERTSFLLIVDEKEQRGERIFRVGSRTKSTTLT